MYTCQRCNGKGRLPEHSNVMNGVCFKCNGTGKQASKPRKPKARKGPDPRIAQENSRKQAQAIEMYKDDPRAGVEYGHQYFYMHATELAKKDGAWETL